MELQAYCENLAIELSAWKTKVDDVVGRLDKISTGDKTKVFPHVNELHMILEEMSDRIDRLRRECPTQWEPEHFEIEGKFTGFAAKVEEGTWQSVSPAEIGG